MRCSEIVGREEELDRLRALVAGLSDRRGGVVALIGDAGAGKSRLVREATGGTRRAGEHDEHDEGVRAVAADAADAGGAGRDVTVLAGRAVPGDSPVPYRPLAEAFLAAMRGRPLPQDPSLQGFEGQLARLVPTWSTGAPADDSPILLGEAVVRLLAVLAAAQPCVLVLEDLHWADPETLAVVDYLGDALRDEATLCLCTSRPGGPATEVLERLERRGAGCVLRLGSLDEREVHRMVGRCLGGDAPAGLRDFIQGHSDGNPFLVEELLAGLVAAGALRSSDGTWEVTGTLTPSVPASLRDSIRHRLDALDPSSRRVLGAAALLGRRFDWELLPGIAEVDGRKAVDALREAVAEQLIEAEGDGFRFRHALTREAVLSDLLPPERRELAARAWPAIERANPGLPGATCQLAADLAEAAGDRAAAAQRLTESARRALAGGALATAEATARRARQLAADAPAALDVDEVLVHVLAAAGKSADALLLGRALADRLATTAAPPTRQADLLVAMVRAAVAAGDLDAAGAAAADARAVAGADPDPALLARIDAVAAEVALDRADLDEAERLSLLAIDGARASGQADVLCEALLVLGRVRRPRGDPEDVFGEAAAVAAAAGLARWHLRAQHELALGTFVHDGGRQLSVTRELAARYGAHITVAVMDLALADAALSDFDGEGSLRWATSCVDASRRYGLATEPVAHLWLAGAHALRGDDRAMHAAIAAARAGDPDDPRILGDLYGRVLASRAFVRDELDTLPALFDEMMVHVRLAPPTTSVYPGRVGWALLHTMNDDDHGLAARTEYHDTANERGLALFERFGEALEAVALGRAGDTNGATARIAPVYADVTAAPLGQGMVRAHVLLLAQAAIRDGWGDPVRWLRDAEAWFADRGHALLVRRARALLGEAGAPVPRRGRGESDVPASLRALGVTSREVDVLKLVMAGRSTKDIASELYLSPKTVERHLTSLFDRTGVRNRQDLAAMGATHLPRP